MEQIRNKAGEERGSEVGEKSGYKDEVRKGRLKITHAGYSREDGFNRQSLLDKEV